MTRKVRIRVRGRLDAASRPQIGTVTIDRGAGLFSVRPFRRRRQYTLPLATLAEHVVQSILRAEVRARGRRRRGRSAPR